MLTTRAQWMIRCRAIHRLLTSPEREPLNTASEAVDVKLERTVSEHPRICVWTNIESDVSFGGTAECQALGFLPSICSRQCVTTGQVTKSTIEEDLAHSYTKTCFSWSRSFYRNAEPDAHLFPPEERTLDMESCCPVDRKQSLRSGGEDRLSSEFR